MSDTQLQMFRRVPIFALSLNSRNDLASHLDAIKILRTSAGVWRDWRGLTQLLGLPNRYFTFLSTKMSPTIDLINILEKERDGITFNDFRDMLSDMDRYDVIDDTFDLFVADALQYLNQRAPNPFNRSQQPQNVDTRMIQESHSNILTMDDVNTIERGLPLQRYHAIILYADEDIEFASEMIAQVEGFGLKVCVKERDLLAGVPFEHDAIRHLLTQRCDRLVVILSPDFLRSPLNIYASNLAQSLGIDQRTRKIIPCLYKECEVPEIFQHIRFLDYEKSKMFRNFWPKLNASLKTTYEDREVSSLNSATDSDQIFSLEDMQSSAGSSNRSQEDPGK